MHRRLGDHQRPDEGDPMTDFTPFPKMARLSRLCTISEKIDGTSGCVYITDDGDFLVGSRNRWITPTDDNYGFAKWAHEHKEELLQLGPGRHFGEWWGMGIQRKYGLQERRWSLFNTARWCLHDQEPKRIESADPRVEKYQQPLPACCHLVPVLFQGPFSTAVCENVLYSLKVGGSVAAPGFPSPEGIVVFHSAANISFKKTIDNDEQPKSKQ